MIYEVLGYATQAQQENVNTDPNAGTAKRPELTVIYTTDDMAEVDQILAAGGYTDSANVWWVAEGYREKDTTTEVISKPAGTTEVPSGGAAPFPRKGNR